MIKNRYDKYMINIKDMMKNRYDDNMIKINEKIDMIKMQKI